MNQLVYCSKCNIYYYSISRSCKNCKTKLITVVKSISSEIITGNDKFKIDLSHLK